VLGVLVVLLLILARVWTEVLWFDQLGYLQVLRTEWVTRSLLFTTGFLVMAGAVAVCLRVAYRSRPVYAPSNQEQASLDQYREAVEPLRKLVMIAGPALLGLFAGGAASQQWTTIQLWLNAVPFGKKDPQYGLDLSFFIFTLPGLRFVVSFLMAVVFLAGLATLATQYLYGGIRLGGQGPRTTATARVQIAIVAATFLLLIAANYWLDRYSLLTKTGDKFEGATYADVNAVIPSKGILAVVAVVVAALFLVTAVRGNWRLPAIGVGLMVVSAIAIGGIYPAVVQRFKVVPNAQELEAKFIQRNIDATKTAFGLDKVEVTPYSAATTATAGALRKDAETAASIRLLDPAIVSPSFRQLQQNKQYYNFADTLSVDRYAIKGKTRDTVIAVRELNLGGLGAGARTWVNDHTVYTHGFGVVAAFGNTTSVDGQPAFFEGGIPSKGELGNYEPRIYFGQNSPDYSIVGAPETSPQWELDYPDDASGGQKNTSFPTSKIKAGPSVGNPWNKLLYALKFGDEELLFSDRVTGESQILYDRDPKDQGRSKCGQPVEQAAVRPEVRRRGAAVLRPGDRGVPDPLRPRPQAAGPEGRALLDAGRTGVPRGHRRQGRLDGRRVHHVGRLPVLRLRPAPGRDGRFAHRAFGHRRRAAPADGELHPQLGQGDRGCVHRQGHAVRLGPEGSGAEGLAEGLPADREAALGHQRGPDEPHPLPRGPVQGPA